MLPRKVPWAPGELEYVFDLVFVSSSPQDHKLGLGRMKTWISRSCCPHAVESTASLLDMILLDNSNNENAKASTSTANSFQVRLGYAMAIIRFVNGLVDPAQQSIYARSIAMIATELGLPLSFVEIRHAATHEDLPSLALLRQGARNGLDWLYEHYWLYQLRNNDMTFEDQNEATSHSSGVQELSTLLKQYKILRKDSLKEASDDESDTKIHNLQSQIEDTILVKLSSSSPSTSTTYAPSIMEKSLAGIETAITVLLEAGYLVPLAKKKRSSSRSKKLSRESILIWMPFLHWLEDIYEGTLEILIYRILDLLLLVDENNKSHASSDEEQTSYTYYYTLCAWLAHLLKETGNHDNNIILLKNIARNCLLCPNPFTLRILEDITENNNDNVLSLNSLVSLLSKDHQRKKKQLADSQIDTTINNINFHLQEMESRLANLSAPSQLSEAPEDVIMQEQPVNNESSKWRLHDSTTWTPCPIGCLPDRSIPSFTLSSVFG